MDSGCDHELTLIVGEATKAVARDGTDNGVGVPDPIKKASR